MHFTVNTARLSNKFVPYGATIRKKNITPILTERYEYRDVSVCEPAYFSQRSRNVRLAFRSLAVTRYAAQSENRRGAEERF